MSKLPEITNALRVDKGGGHTLLQRHQAKVSTLTCKQTSFFWAQHRKYKQHLRCNKRMQQHVVAAILATGLKRYDSKTGVGPCLAP